LSAYTLDRVALDSWFSFHGHGSVSSSFASGHNGFGGGLALVRLGYPEEFFFSFSYYVLSTIMFCFDFSGIYMIESLQYKENITSSTQG